MIADATVLDLALPLDCEDGPSTRVSNDLKTETIIEEFIQFKLKKQGKLLQRRSGPSDIETQVLVGRLIEISNELEVRYGEQLNQDAQLWIQSASFENFVQIARGVFADGVISWSRIVVLFMFAVKVVYNALSKNLRGLARDVIKFAVQFIFVHGIYKWIESHGGWFAVLRDYGPGSSTGGLLVFAGLLVVALFFAAKAT